MKLWDGTPGSAGHRRCGPRQERVAGAVLKEVLSNREAGNEFIRTYRTQDTASAAKEGGRPAISHATRRRSRPVRNIYGQVGGKFGEVNP
jgi:hypothetical protein